MAGFARAIGFLISAVGVELFRGVGVVALLAATLAGWRRWHVIVLVAIVAGFAALSIVLPETGPETGKVLHGLSNLPFVALVYIVIAIGGYAVGRVMRRMQS